MSQIEDAHEKAIITQVEVAGVPVTFKETTFNAFIGDEIRTPEGVERDFACLLSDAPAIPLETERIQTPFGELTFEEVTAGFSIITGLLT